jgi:tetratricopeptide (TPR) repeat protein
VKPTAISRNVLRLIPAFWFLALVLPWVFQNSVLAQSTSSKGQPRKPPTTQKEFEEGELALRSGDLDRAERHFRQVLALEPKSAGAYADLGVIYMRRKQWDRAISFLKKAERLAPKIAGIRLNLGLAYYRQSMYAAATPMFESVVKEQPDSSQARYLLGLCYFFTNRWSQATETLDPLWGEQSLNLMYLYVLDIAAHNAGRSDLDRRAAQRMSEIGGDTPEFHMLIGKAHLNNDEYDEAISEFEKAARANPKMPLLHYHLGVAYTHKQNYEAAANEFRQDIAVEPDVAFNYDRLGVLYAMQQNDAEAENNFRRAIALDPRIPSSHFGLAKIYLRQKNYSAALAALDAAEKLAPDDYNIHAVRGQALQQSGQRAKAAAEFAVYTRMLNAAREKREKEMSGEIRNPELMSTPD